jgi:aspartyl-tRNA(Asn)/glutamyl-tRNA(Gln) amidotransferase subunit A
MDLSRITIASARKSLDAKEFSALELTNAYLEEITKKDKDIHAYLEVWGDTAREEAKKADEMIANPKPISALVLAFAALRLSPIL